ncbi:MAG TPA: YceI family protein, partial [Alphaproteobacteria bacterium]|nr:YceI family protein [Alphaproteobacteria bacterium]
YVAMIGMPLSGWIMSSAGQHPLPFFGITMPDIVGPNRELGHLMHEVHEVLAFTLIGVIGLHALGALKHHFIDKDSTLTRMMAGRMQRIGPYILIIILGLFGLGVLGLLASEDEHEHEEKEKIEKVSVLEQPAALQGENAWEIAKDQSTLQFRASVYGREFTGNFGNFGGKIIFDPDNLQGSVADITIDTRSIRSDDEERDANMIGEEWFDVAQYPTAHFKTTAFEKKDDNNYIAVGELTIKNHSMPVMLPFKLDIIEGKDDLPRRAYVDGSVTLNRLDFGLGEGRWKTADSISLDTVVDIKLVAKSI